MIATSSRTRELTISSKWPRITALRIELLIALVLLVLANFPLLGSRCNTALLFLPDRVIAGEWWRVFTHPWVHVSWYNLALDAGAFLMLYADLRSLTPFQRIAACVMAAAGSLLTALCFDGHLSTNGICGLSGIAHGLMAISALEMMRSARAPVLVRLGAALFCLVVIKCAAEAITGTVIFDGLHGGRVGAPVAVSHAGGVLGVLFMTAVGNLRRSRAQDQPDATVSGGRLASLAGR